MQHPSVILGVGILAVVYAAAAASGGRRPSRRQAAWFASALVAILIAHGPVDALAEGRLFAAHMFQHFLQTMVIPPLLLLGIPERMISPWLSGRRMRRTADLITRPVVAFLLFSTFYMAAHSPPVFDLMCRDEPVHIAVHLGFLATGVVLWWPILSPVAALPRLSYPGQILYLFLLMIPMIAVAAPITLARSVVYPWYLEGAHPAGIPPLDDQVLGGLLMWVGQALYLMCIFTAIFFRWSRREDRDNPSFGATIVPDLKAL